MKTKVKELIDNPKKHINFTIKKEVEDYYNSFDRWNFYVCMGDTNTDNCFLVEIDDDIVKFGEQYYMPAPNSTYQNTYGKKEEKFRGWAWVHFINKKDYTFDRSSSSIKPKETFIFNIWHVYAKVDKNPTKQVLKNLKENNGRIICYNSYDRDFRVEYHQNGRSGLHIQKIWLENFRDWFTKEYLCQSTVGQYGKQIIFPSEEFFQFMEFGEQKGFPTWTIKDEINKILNNATYNIDDSEDYGEYSFNYLEIDENHCKMIHNLIKDRLNQYYLLS